MDKDQEAEIKAAFKQYDLDGNGYISKGEVRLVFARMGIEPTNAVDAFFKKADLNRDGRIDYEEFTQFYLNQKQ